MEQTAFELNRGLWRETRPRLGVRTVVGRSVRWRLPGTEGPTQPAVVHDLSITGARLLVPADDAIVPNAAIDLELDDEWSATRVVWLDDSAHRSARWCGVSLQQPSPAFLAAAARITGHRPGAPASSLSWEEGGAGGFSA